MSRSIPTFYMVQEGRTTNLTTTPHSAIPTRAQPMDSDPQIDYYDSQGNLDQATTLENPAQIDPPGIWRVVRTPGG